MIIKCRTVQDVLLSVLVNRFGGGRLGGQELEELGDCGREWRRRGQVVADGDESLWSSSVLDADRGAVRCGVCVTAFDVQGRLVWIGSRHDDAAFLGLDTVAGFVSVERVYR